MKKSVLITGGGTLLGQQLIDQYITRDWQVATAVASGTGEENEIKPEQKESLLLLPWNRNSLFSAKTIVRETLRCFGGINEVVIIHQAPVLNTPFEETSLTEMDDVVGECINGTVYLTREVLDFFSDKSNGLLSFALQDDLGDIGPAITDGSAGFFRYFVRGIICKKKSGLFQTAYYSPKPDHRGFSEFIYRYNQTRNEKGNGEWLRHSEKKPVFSSLPIIKKEF